MSLLAGHAWPGNVRELRNALERMIVLARSETLTVRDMPAALREETRGRVGLPAGPVSLDEAEKQMILRALKACDDNRTRAAAQLGISRRTLHRKLKEYGVAGESGAEH